MKTIYSLAFGALILLLVGCVHFPTKSADIAYSPAIKQGDVIEMAIEVARSLDFPPATKIDKANGIVEFGAFGQPMLGITAQVRVKSEGQLEVNVTRGSEYVPLGVDKKADEFRDKLEERLRTASK
ncbi:MAG TPA: hypothetical protein VH413_11450 [Verrucomicrobiae bacterium]|jgi:hypothetical protein|nr:hypothetical protein [Verrucomicrobiae bacterium]